MKKIVRARFVGRRTLMKRRKKLSLGPNNLFFITMVRGTVWDYQKCVKNDERKEKREKKSVLTMVIFARHAPGPTS